MPELINSFKLYFNTILPIMLLLGVIGLIAGVLRVSTQIEDKSVSFVIKFSSVLVLCYFLKDASLNQILSFSVDMWGSFKYFNG